ncbi:hypothetical protein, partial [Staphylococcus epidermidis]
PPVLFKIRHLNNITGVFSCQIFFSTTKTNKNTVISTINHIFKKERYFYIVSRQEETRFQLVSKDKKNIPKKYIVRYI